MTTTRSAVVEDTGSLGVRRNARLTSLTGFVLLLALFAEGVTVLSVGSLVVPHIVIGTFLLAPVALKLGTTGWKILRYYTGAPAYVHAGPPPFLRRLLAPVVMLSTVGLLGTGVVLMLHGPGSTDRMAFLHKAFFVVWFAAMTLHVLIHVVRSVRSVATEYAASREAVVPGRGVRLLVLAACVLVGLGLAAWSTGYTAPWTHLFGH